MSGEGVNTPDRLNTNTNNGVLCSDEGLHLAQQLIDAGFPVVVCRPHMHRRCPGRCDRELDQPARWNLITADRCDLSSFRPGTDTLALVTGHGVDVVDVDTKDGGRLDILPPYQRFGRHQTPSGGFHDFVRSTGLGKISPLKLPTGHVGDYCGGTASGAGRMLAYLPGSSRPKYRQSSYVVLEPLDLDALLDSEPDDDLVDALMGAGGTFLGHTAHPAAAQAQVAAFLADHESVMADPCRYGRKALAEILARAPQSSGGRHAWMVASACRLVELCLAGCCTSEDLHQLVDRLRHIKPEGGTDPWAAVGWAVGNARASTRCRRHAPRAAGEDERTGSVDRLQQGRLRSIPLGRRLALEQLVGRFIFAPDLGWLRWDGRRWSECPREAIMAEAATWAEEFIIDLLRTGAPREDVDFALRYREVRQVEQLVAGAKTAGSPILVDASQLDQHRDLLNVQNGVVDLQTGELLPHDPGLLLTKMAGTDYRPDARHRDWDTALSSLPDDETARWLQIYLGTACSGWPTMEDVITVWNGGGANGKSTLLHSCAAALGNGPTGHARTVAKTLLTGRRQEHPTQVMDLRGLRLAIMEETGEDHHLETVRLKELIGTETLKARAMYKNFVEFSASHTLVLTTNHRPLVTDTDHGTWRRLSLIPFTHTYGTGKGELAPDPGLRQRLINGPEQREAVLAWLVAGAKAWYSRHRTLPALPASVVKATKEWRIACDVVLAFAEEWLIFEADARVEVEEVRATFNAWLEMPAPRWPRQSFRERVTTHPVLRQRGLTSGRHPATRRAELRGVRLRTLLDPDQDLER